MTKIKAGDIELNVVDEGAGPTVLFVHGFPLNHGMWRAQLDEFSKTHRVIAPDLRGFGESDVTPGTVSMQQFADDLDALLTSLAVEEPVTFCGLSMGGYVAWQFARRHGDRLRSLILCDTRAAADTREGVRVRFEMADKILKDGAEAAVAPMLSKLLAENTPDERPQLVEQLKAIIAATNPQGMAAALRGMAERLDATEMLPAIRLPCLCVVGQEDKLSTVREMRSMADAIPDARMVAIERAGHMAPMEKPQQVNQAIREFLEDLENA